MTSLVYAALFIVLLAACGLGLLLAILAEILSGMNRHLARVAAGKPAQNTSPEERKWPAINADLDDIGLQDEVVTELQRH